MDGLSSYTMQQLIDEITTRVEAGVIALVLKDKDDKFNQFKLYYTGGITHAIGIAHRAMRVLERDADESMHEVDCDDETEGDDDDE